MGEIYGHEDAVKKVVSHKVQKYTGQVVEGGDGKPCHQKAANNS
jgi:hypothetical protein